MLGLKRKTGKDGKLTFFNDTWEEVELIGAGNFGKVYKAKRKDGGLTTYYCAIKQIKIPQSQSEINELKTEGNSQEEITAEFKRRLDDLMQEIELMAVFKDSQNIVNIEDYETIKSKNGIDCTINIRMELLKNIDAYILENKVVTDKETIKMAIDILTALEDCEQNNVIHRDVKPDNIFINSRGIYKLGDFGVAKRMSPSVSNMSRKGTENYMAPELLKKEKGNKTVDIYSLGIVIYKYFNYNRLPFLPEYPNEISSQDREDALQKRITGEKMLPPQNAPREIAEIILKACSYYQKDRYANATEFKEDLQRIYENMTTPRVLFDYKRKENIIENSVSTSHDTTYSFMDRKAKERQEIKDIIEENKEEQEKLENEEPPKELETEEELPKEIKIEKETEIETEKELPQEVETKIGTKIKTEIKKETEKEIKKETDKSVVKEKPNKEKQEENKIKSKLEIKLKNSKNKIIAIIAIILIILAIALAFILKPKQEEPQYITMKSYVGMQSEDATNDLKSLELEVEYEYVENEEELGKVLEQSINENEQIVKGTVVTLKVAVSPEKVKVINVLNYMKDAAQSELENIGLSVSITEQYNDEIEQGRVISQMPGEGEEVNKHSTVELLVSLGKEATEETPPEEEQLPTTKPSTQQQTTTTKPSTTQPTQQTQPTQPTQPSQPKVIAPTGITLGNTQKFIEKGKTVKFTAKVSPSNATNQKVVWSSNNSSIISVAQDGTVKGVGNIGKATITATIEGANISTRFEVTVYIKGDVNRDGRVTKEDSDMILNFYREDGHITEEDYLRGDMDGNGIFNTTDSAKILDIVANGR